MKVSIDTFLIEAEFSFLIFTDVFHSIGIGILTVQKLQTCKFQRIVLMFLIILLESYRFEIFVDGRSRQCVSFELLKEGINAISFLEWKSDRPNMLKFPKRTLSISKIVILKTTGLNFSNTVSGKCFGQE